MSEREPERSPTDPTVTPFPFETPPEFLRRLGHDHARGWSQHLARLTEYVTKGRGGGGEPEASRSLAMMAALRCAEASVGCNRFTTEQGQGVG